MAEHAHSTPASMRAATTHTYIDDAELRALLRPRQPTHDKDMRPIRRAGASAPEIAIALIAPALLMGAVIAITAPDPVTAGHAYALEAVR